MKNFTIVENIYKNHRITQQFGVKHAIQTITFFLVIV
ncbi:unnamed protein product [Trichobilharzia regenti]|nr:unnamed protein product [Trichobilharzia regenti]